jgi:hypothetical protein
MATQWRWESVFFSKMPRRGILRSTTVAGSFATALGSLFAGLLVQFLQSEVVGSVNSYRTIVILYACVGVVLTILFRRLSTATEVHRPAIGCASVGTVLGIGHSRGLVLKLLCTVRSRLICGWIRNSELRRVLVLPSFRRQPGNTAYSAGCE